MEWIRTANLRKYNVIEAFNSLTCLDWVKSGFDIEKEDIVYIYVGKPFSRIMFKRRIREYPTKSFGVIQMRLMS